MTTLCAASFSGSVQRHRGDDDGPDQQQFENQVIRRLGATNGALVRRFVGAILQRKRGNPDAGKQMFAALRCAQTAILGRGT